MNFVEEYTRQWTKRETKDIDTFSECDVVDTSQNLKKPLNHVNGSKSTRATSTQISQE